MIALFVRHISRFRPFAIFFAAWTKETYVVLYACTF